MKKSVGLMGMIGGGLCLSLEIYMLRVLQGLDKVTDSWHDVMRKAAPVRLP